MPHRGPTARSTSARGGGPGRRRAGWGRTTAPAAVTLRGSALDGA
ncbi:hypothetical protein Ae168Ps1_5187 [Pseudonocardia sp. Ae168_Ps1]|nr:hypothetical protein Ae168Ps1_5187 [Pseudonocardia sp. Ae168_Ps1]